MLLLAERRGKGQREGILAEPQQWKEREAGEQRQEDKHPGVFL
jgi:hypothetical protein